MDIDQVRKKITYIHQLCI